MGTPKHLLHLKDGKPLYMHRLSHLAQACPNAKAVYISVRDPEQAFHVGAFSEFCTSILYDGKWKGDIYIPAPDIGPASGLLAAHRHSPDSHWLLLACDYPLMTVEELLRLKELFEEPLTCFRNEEGFPEPLVGIWSPAALQRLQENVAKGVTGPARVVKMLGIKCIEPVDNDALVNTNTREEWDRAMQLAGYH